MRSSSLVQFDLLISILRSISHNYHLLLWNLIAPHLMASASNDLLSSFHPALHHKESHITTSTPSQSRIPHKVLGRPMPLWSRKGKLYEKHPMHMCSLIRVSNAWLKRFGTRNVKSKGRKTSKVQPVCCKEIVRRI